jgi:signal transduction histidine kinase
LDPGRYTNLIINDTGQEMNPKLKGLIFDSYFTSKEVGKNTEFDTKAKKAEPNDPAFLKR